MTKTILIATEKPFAEAALQQMRQEVEATDGFVLKLLEHYASVDELEDAIVDADAVIVRSDIMSANTIELSKKLKVIVRAGAGYDNVDVVAATEKDIIVMNTPGQNSNAVAELGFGLMLGLIRRKYLGGAGSELMGKTIGMHGFGYIGKCMARIAKGFNMETLAFDPYLDHQTILALGVKPCESVEDLYRESDFISLNIPVNNGSAKSINYQLLSQTKPNALLVNTARKELIEEEDLMRILDERPAYMYASDIAPTLKVTMEEKFPMRTLFTSNKMGAQTVEANRNAGLAAVRQIIDYFINGDTTFKVN
ncbi:MAG: NAD(P)-dependent oxidoreductase [Cyclobacteriaceae bacterium]